MSPFVLHVGPPKTGTTTVQQVLLANVDRLARHGVGAVTDEWLLRDAASELAGVPHERPGSRHDEAVAELRTLVTGDPDALVVASCERFSVLDEDQARRTVDELGVEVRAVVTLRAPAALLPSRWQERVKNGGTETWSEFCARVASDPPFLHQMLRMRSTLRAWIGALGPAGVTVVTVPTGRPAQELVDRFRAAAGISAEALGEVPPARHNPSLAVEGVEVLRRLNELGTLSGAATRAERKALLAGLFAGDDDAPVPSAPASAAIADYARQLVAELDRSGCAVLGSNEDLTATGSGSGTTAEPPPEAVLDAAVRALSALAERTHALHEQDAHAPRARSVRRGWRQRWRRAAR